MPDDVVYLTVQDVAKRLQVTEETVRRWIDHGSLKAIKLSKGRYRIHPADFEDFLRRQQEQ